MTIVIIANPHATGVTTELLGTVVDVLERANSVDVRKTTVPGEASKLADAAVRASGTQAVIAVGGDGTVNEVVNGLLAANFGDGIPPLGVVPAGATNVFARSLGFPNDPIQAATMLRMLLEAGSNHKIGVGRVAERYFTFCAGVGLDAAVIEHVHRQRARGEPSTLSRTAFAAARQLLSAQRPQLDLALPNAKCVNGLAWLVVTNTDPWTYVYRKPLRPTPHASFDLGLDIYALDALGPLRLARSLVQMSRRHPRHDGKGIQTAHNLSNFDIQSIDPVAVQVDGESLARSSHLRFTSVPLALPVIAPSPYRSVERR